MKGSLFLLDLPIQLISLSKKVRDQKKRIIISFPQAMIFFLLAGDSHRRIHLCPLHLIDRDHASNVCGKDWQKGIQRLLQHAEPEDFE